MVMCSKGKGSHVKTFIRVVEVWVPDNQRTHLEYGGGLYSNAPSFGVISRQLVFGRGEGLPGQAWERGMPVVLTQFEGSYFRRTAAARAAGLTSGIAVPVFAGEFLTSVLVFFCGDDEAHAGAIELWHAAPAISPDMKMVDAYYGTTAEVFEFISRSTTFRKGIGLPGMAWENGAPVFIEDLGKSDRFLRGDTATRVGINRGLAIPCFTRNDEICVLTFLSALGTPTARRFEVWVPDDSRQYLHRVDGFCESAGRLSEVRLDMMLERGQGAIGRSFLTGVPALSEQAPSELGSFGAELERCGLNSMATLPLIDQGRLTAVVAWYF